MSRSYNKEEGYPSGYLKKLCSIRNSLVEFQLLVTKAGYTIKFPDQCDLRRNSISAAKRKKLPDRSYR